MSIRYSKGLGRSAVAFLLVMALSICILGAYSTEVMASMNTPAVISCLDSEVVSARTGPGTTYPVMHKLANNKPITILDTATAANGKLWYKVKYKLDANGEECISYVHSAYVKVETTGNSDSDYAKQLKDAGFPSSYINDLCALHDAHPNWVFEAVITNLDWNTVITKESVNGLNLVSKSQNDSRKSTESGAYDWKTDTWTIYDGSSWVSASKEYISYCMDPRNFLNETYIFQFESLSYNRNQNLAGVQSVVKGSFMEKSVTDTDKTALKYDQAFLKIGSDSNVLVSPYHLAARVRQEQGTKGTSSLISGTYSGYEGYFNYYNFGAYGVTSSAVIQAGLSYAKRQGWNTRYKALYGGAQMIGKNYIARGQDTLYFQKFNVVYKSALYSHQYMGNVSAAISEAKTVASGYSDKDQAFVFRIPVYKNMPATAVTFVEKGNPNNYLKTLSASGITLTPVFSGDKTSYTAIVPESTTSTNIVATAVNSKSTISGTGTKSLKVGENTVTIKCTAESGVTRSYTIKIVRQGTEASPEADYELKSTKYTVGSYITGISPNTNSDAIMKNVSSANGTVKITKSDGKVNSGTVGTGNKIRIVDTDGKVQKEYTVLIYGDINGDGNVDALDMIKLNRHVLGIDVLSGTALKAADVNRKNDGVNALDMIALNRYTLGLSTIQQ